MNAVGKAARLMNMIISVVGSILIVLMFLYGGYSLWNNEVINRNAFVSDELLQYKPKSEDPEANALSFEELCEINPDVIGWLTIDDTNIDYPVVIGENDLTYVNKDVMGDYSLSGAIFLSCLNSRDFSDDYNIIYGHHMDNGAMFGNIMDYLDEDYYDSHLTGTLYTKEKTYLIKVFACVECDAYDSNVYAIGEFSFKNLRKYLSENALYYDSAECKKAEKIVAMSTCVSALTNGRVVVFGRLYEDN